MTNSDHQRGRYLTEMARSFRAVLEGFIYVPLCLADVLPNIRPPLARPDASHAGMPRAGALTGRQQDVLSLLRQGQSNKQIARLLNLAVGIVKVHVNAVFRTLDVHSRLDAITLSDGPGQQAVHRLDLDGPATGKATRQATWHAEDA